MKRFVTFVIVMALVLMAAGVAGAHGGVGFRISIGLPLFFAYNYPAGYYGYPAPYVYYQPRVRVYDDPYISGTVVENIYVNGRLVERRIRVNGDRYGYGSDRRYDQYGDYGRR
jgi:hypothetical protein